MHAIVVSHSVIEIMIVIIMLEELNIMEWIETGSFVKVTIPFIKVITIGRPLIRHRARFYPRPQR